MAPSTPPRTRKAPKPSAKAIRNQETRTLTEALDHDGRSSPSHEGNVEPSARDGSASDLETLIQLITDLKETITRQSNIIENQNNGIEDIRAELGEIKAEQRTLKGQNLELQEEVRSLRTQLDSHPASLPSTGNAAFNTSVGTSPNPSYADVARTPPNSAPANVHSISSMGTTPSTMTDTLYCTVDTSRVASEDAEKVSVGAIRANVEKEMRNTSEQINWRCRAVTKDQKNPHRIRITCRDEAEHKEVKRVIEANLVTGMRVLRDDLYPIRVDGVNRTAVLDEAGNDRTGAAEALGMENETQVAKIVWLSNRDVAKAYGSMLVYLNKGSDARRLLQEGYFHAGGESGSTKPFERRERPKQCYNCQEITGHKAYQCTKPQVCGRCAKGGHRHTECTETLLKCVPCGGPHESFSKNCRKLYPAHHE